MRVYWKSEEEAVPLEYYMNVYGISRDSFLIFIDPHEEGMHNLTIVISIILLVLNLGAIITSNADGTKDDVRTHDLTSEIKDVNELCQEVAEIGNWDVLCSYLGVNPAKMDKLRHSNAKIKEKKQECLRAYFDMGEANWNDVAEVIKKPPISNNRVAKRIAKKHNLRDEL